MITLRFTLFSLILVGISGFIACSDAQKTFQAYIEIPAGTNLKLEYNFNNSELVPDSLNGVARVIDYLPYPANYGFIIGTIQDEGSGGDGVPLDVLVISSALQPGDSVEVIPLGVIQTLDDGEKDDKIIAIPAKAELQTVNASSFRDLKENYPGIIEIFEIWFSHYNQKNNITEIVNTGDEKLALELIRKYSVH